MKALIASVVVAASATVASAQPASTPAGTNPMNFTSVSSTATASAAWWSFDITQSIGPATLGTYLIIDTFPNTFTGGSFGAGDSELGLYDGLGARLGQWDDTTGVTLARRERVLFGDAAAATLAGHTGFQTVTTVLNPGTFYVASGPFNVTFNTTAWNVTVAPSFPAGGGVVGNAGINIVSNVPAPGSLALLGLGGLMMARRRRA